MSESIFPVNIGGIAVIPDILLVRNDDGYRILHGHLRLATILSTSSEAIADASGEGKVKILKTPDGTLIQNEHGRLPLLTGK